MFRHYETKRFWSHITAIQFTNAHWNNECNFISVRFCNVLNHAFFANWDRENGAKARASAFCLFPWVLDVCTIPYGGVVIRKLDRTLLYEHTTDKAKWFFILQSLYASTNTSHSVQSRPLYLWRRACKSVVKRKEKCSLFSAFCVKRVHLTLIQFSYSQSKWHTDAKMLRFVMALWEKTRDKNVHRV